MRRLLIITLVLMLAILTSCTEGKEPEQNPAAEQTTENTEESTEMASIMMTINGEKLEVTWEDNESVKALAELAAEEPVTIDASKYGGFEQVGSIGTTLPSSDVSTTTEPGDIVLYTGSSIVVFYGSNSWSYTRLGHIENKSKSELEDLLGADKVTIVISAE